LDKKTIPTRTSSRNCVWISAALTAVLLPWVGPWSSQSARAGELDGFDGRLESNNSDVKTYTWGLEYREPLTDHFAASFAWLNEGHLPNNHRDGQAVQLWWHTRTDPVGLVFEGGVGPYRYYDTHALNPDPEFRDVHGWGAVASAAVDWYFASHWFTYLRVNEISDKYSSTSLVAGAGFRFSSKFDLSPGAGDPGSAATGGAAAVWEIDGLMGERIANTTHSEAGLAESLQISRLLGEDDDIKDASSPSNLAVMVSVSVAYSITPRWTTRVVWDRIGTGDDHDCDIVLLGAGYKY
jgi:hypothetical protein